MRALIAFGLLVFPLTALGQAKEVRGIVYSFIDKDGVRAYSAKKPAAGRDVRVINYNYLEGEKAYPPYIYRCRVGKEDRYTQTPIVGCVVAGSLASQAKSFSGYRCKDDCSGHEAGYQWAGNHGITDPDDCGGNSQSFIEGCQAYAEEQAGE